MKKICQTALKLLESGEGFVQATTLASSGSTPRKAGSYMLVAKNGEIEGSVGGGALEGTIIKAAARVIASEKPEVITISLDGTDAAAGGAVCGGTASVLVDYIAPDGDAIDFYSALLSALRTDNRARIVTAVHDDAKPGSERLQCLLLSDGTLTGCGGFNTLIAEELGKNPRGYDAFTKLENHQVYLHPIGSDGTVYIFGAGHCGEKLAHILATVSFNVVVIDDREEFANAQRFPEADAILVPKTLDKPFTALEFDADSYIVIVTRGHMHDELVLRGALKTNAGYIGMIGSRSKRETIYKNIRADGYTQADIDRVHSPIGIEIDADTPEEIAVSIAAELIKSRAAHRT